MNRPAASGNRFSKRVAVGLSLLSLHAAAAGAAVLYENPTVRVLRNRYSPNLRSAMHEHASGRFVYVISGGSLRVQVEERKTEAPGKPPKVETRQIDIALEGGRAAWRLPERHALENVGSSTIDVLEVEVKEADEKACLPEDAKDLGPPEESGGAESRFLFRNRWGAVVGHLVRPGGTLACPLAGHERFFYWLTSSEFASPREDRTERKVPRATGAFDWFLPGREPRGVNEGPETVEAVEVILEKSLPKRRMVITGAEGDGGQ